MTDPGFVLNLLHTAFSISVTMILLCNFVTMYVFPKVVKVSQFRTAGFEIKFLVCMLFVLQTSA